MLCQVYPHDYQQQLQQKTRQLLELIPAMSDSLEVFASAPSHYRQRAEFRIWHTQTRLFYAMFNADKQPIEIERCPMAAQAIDELMPELLAAISASDELKQNLFEVDFLSTLSGEMLVTLIYRRKLDETEWRAAAQTLRDKLAIDHVIGRSRKQKILLDQDYVIEHLQADDKHWRFQQIENSFTQPNAQMAQHMLGWARQQSRVLNPNAQHDLLELYCGNGHFSIALADLYRRVLATEISKTSVKSAKFNCELNQLDNVDLVKMAAEDVSQALKGREYQRLADIDLERYDFQTIFVDPPRAGLDELTRTLASEFEHILYVSCNPQTLAYDLERLTQTHEMVASALFDQFPYTHHIESAVALKRKH